MNRLFRDTLSLLGVIIFCTSCGGGAYVKYHMGPSDGTGYNFVIPRTVVKVEVDHGGGSPATSQAAAGKKGATGARATSDPTPSRPATLSFTPVPVITTLTNEKEPKEVNLPILSVTDDSGTFGLVTTSITNVTYADHLIIQSIGTEITDNRKAVIDVVVGVVGIVTAVAGVALAPEIPPRCPDSPDLEKLEPFVIWDIHDSPQVNPVPGNPCWGYQVIEQKEMGDMSVGSFPLKDQNGKITIPTETKVSWFPYPACRNYNISVFPCDPTEKSCKPYTGHKKYSTILSVADGNSYRRVPLPPKGKVSMHTNFCEADVTSGTSPLASDWDLMKQLIDGVKNLTQKQSSTTTAGGK